MYDVMLIDDDLTVRQRLRAMIDWKALGLRVVCEATDSDSAMDLYLLHRPKIVITDICIPIISGLELADAIAALDPDVRFIVITGYTDFEYAKHSVRLGAVDLLSKPIFPEDLTRSLQKALDYFYSKREAFQRHAALNRIVSDYLPQLQAQFLQKILRSPEGTEDLLRKRCSELRIILKNEAFAVVTMELEYPNRRSGSKTKLALYDTILSELREAGLQPCGAEDSHDIFNCLLNIPAGTPDDFIEEQLSMLQNKLLLVADCRLHAGIGRIVSALTDCPLSYAEAIVALNYQDVLREDDIIHYKNIRHFELTLPDSQQLQEYLLALFRKNKLDELVVAIETHLHAISVRDGDGSVHVRSFCADYLHSILMESMRLGMPAEQLEALGLSISALQKHRRISEQVNYIMDATKLLLGRLFQKPAGQSNHLVELAKEFVNEHLPDPALDMALVSDHVGLSKIYFCRLFHKEEGVSFSNYLKFARIERAKQMLLQTNMKVFEISDAAGFSNAKYFGYVFKQEVGLTPLEFQKISAHSHSDKENDPAK